MPPREPGDARAEVPRAGVEAPVGLLERATSPHTRRAYAMARRQLDAWLEGRPLDDASLAAYLGHLHDAGRSPATAAMVVAAVKRAARDASTAVPIGRLVGSCAAAVRSLHAAVSPEPGDSVVGLSVDQINRRFAAACAAAGLAGRRTSHGGRVGLAVELTARGASTHAIQIAGGWKGPAMVVRYAASISTREGAVSKYLR